MSPSAPRGLSFTIGGLSPRGERPRSAEAQYHVLVVADCSGRAARGVCQPLAGRAASALDVDRLELIMRGWGARLPTPLVAASGEAFWLEPRSLDDLHPDQLLVSAVPLAELFELRGKLERDVDARARLAALLERVEPAAPAPSAERAPEPASGESTEDTLSRLLGGSRPPQRGASETASAPAVTAGGVDLSRLIRTIVGNAATQREAAAPSPALASAADAEIGARLRALLSSPALRALEATWRGIDALCRNNPDEGRVRMSVLDASFEELERGHGALPALLERTGADVLLVDREVDASGAELRTLARLLEACAGRGVTLVAGARPHLAGCADFAERESPEEQPVPLPDDARAAWGELAALRAGGARLALALPRYLLRQPYGASGEPLDRLAFEEILDPACHEAFCWGNGAYLVARALCLTAADPGCIHPDGGVDVRELPVVHLEGDDGGRIKPCAEAWLSERAFGRLRGAGFSVLYGWRDTDRVRVFV
ncbi:MAG TPA: type VI secretion system contractile sheath large subunit [Polyangiaceae bacterium]|nr:type VI secretion system contractile sheath large subunit [Polyangiaceae bacterium]